VARTTPEVALALALEFERRLRGVKTLAWGLATTDVESRLYRLLLNLARDQGEVGAGGTVIRAFLPSGNWPAESAHAARPFPELLLTWPGRDFLLCRGGA